MARLELVGGLGEAGVLALVVADDAVEAVAGEEPAVAHHPGLVRLDAEAEVHDGVDVGVLGDQAHHVGDRVTGLAAGAVDRVVAAPPRRQQRVDGVAEVVGQGQQARGRRRGRWRRP